MPAALPTDHDDDHGGAARRAAASLWSRRRRRVAPTARHRDRRRSRRQPAVDALYDAGHLPLSRSLPLVGAVGVAGMAPGTPSPTASRRWRLTARRTDDSAILSSCDCVCDACFGFGLRSPTRLST